MLSRKHIIFSPWRGRESALQAALAQACARRLAGSQARDSAQALSRVRLAPASVPDADSVPALIPPGESEKGHPFRGSPFRFQWWSRRQPHNHRKRSPI